MDKNLMRLEPIGKEIEIFVSDNHIFGTDAVLLADFAAAKPSDRLVDLGTGCGIIPFLMLRDGKTSRSFGVDISEEAITLAENSAQKNGFSSFTAILSDLNDLKGKLPFGSNTLVTCNPPYKADGAGIKNPDDIKRTARHEVKCSLEDIISTGAKLLQTSGRFCMCHRPERLGDIICLMRKYKVEAKRLRIVCQCEGCEPWLVLIEGRRCGNAGMRIAPPLYIENSNGDFSDEMLRIYGPYKALYK